MNTDQSTSRIHQSAIIWLIVPALALMAVLLFDLLPVLRGNDEWRWPLRPIELTARLLIPIVTLGVYVFLSALWLRGFERASASRRYERWFLLFVISAAPLVQLSLAFAVSRVPLLEFFGPTVSAHNSGYFTTAVSTPDLNTLLANYPAQMPALPIHAQSHPPGPVIAHWLSWQVFRALPPLADAVAMPLRTLQCHNPALMALDNAQIAGASLAMLLPLLGGLAVWPLYAFAKRVTSVRVAVIAALVFPVLPLFALWMSQWDQIYPLLLLLGLYLVQTGLTAQPSTLPVVHPSDLTELQTSEVSKTSEVLWQPIPRDQSVKAAGSTRKVFPISWRRILLAGVPLSLASFFSVGNFVLMVIVGLYGVAWLWLQRKSLRLSLSQSLRLAIVFALGCASIWLLYWLVYGVNPFDVISTSSRLAFESTTGTRSYGVWLLGNPIDFLVFLGSPIALVLVYNLIKRLPFPRSLLPVAVATVGTLLGLWLSGIVRGEVGRLWMYFGPLVVMIAIEWQEAGGRKQEAGGKVHVSRFTFYAALIALTALQLIIMNTRWLVNDSYLDEPPARSVVLNPPPVSFVTSAEFVDQIALRGYDVDRASDTIELTLLWQALAQPPHAYTVFAHVIDVNGQQVGQQDNMPVRDQLPTSCWVAGEYVSDPYVIPLAADARGPFQVLVGLYRSDTGARLPRSDAQGDSVTLAVP